MSRTQKQKLGFWFGNFMILCSLILILWQYHNLYMYGHLQCGKSELVNDTMYYAFWGYMILMFVVLLRLSSMFSKKKYVAYLFSFLLVSSIILSTYMSNYFVDLIINKVNDRLVKQINLDGCKTKGIVSFNYYTTKSSKGRHTDYYYIKFKYFSGIDSVSSCYSFGRQIQNYKAGDTINFLISKSNPEYIKILE